VDLNTLVRPRFCVMDGIMAMEGNGPRSGVMRKLNVLLFSTDPIALDATACRIINVDPEVVTTSKLGEKAGLGTYHSENIELVGDSLESFLCRDFDAIRTLQEHHSHNKLKAFIKNRMCERPVIAGAKCTSCGSCVKMCPVDPKVLSWRKKGEKKPPVYDYDRCIRCYCCQESCPEGAIAAKSTLLGKILFRA
jgi:Pyruvate/2-oxoacid:ferredoxin oxidoreductase delta subunit